MTSYFSFLPSPLPQARVREGLVNLLNTCGQRVGLPKSPSVSTVKGGGLLTLTRCRLVPLIHVFINSHTLSLRLYSSFIYLFFPEFSFIIRFFTHQFFICFCFLCNLMSFLCSFDLMTRKFYPASRFFTHGSLTCVISRSLKE